MKTQFLRDFDTSNWTFKVVTFSPMRNGHQLLLGSAPVCWLEYEPRAGINRRSCWLNHPLGKYVYLFHISIAPLPGDEEGPHPWPTGQSPIDTLNARFIKFNQWVVSLSVMDISLVWCQLVVDPPPYAKYASRGTHCTKPFTEALH
jgi:hypothetical protein